MPSEAVRESCEEMEGDLCWSSILKADTEGEKVSYLHNEPLMNIVGASGKGAGSKVLQ